MSETKRGCCTCKYAERTLHQEPCRTCRRSKVYGIEEYDTEEYDTAPDLWKPRIPPAVKPVEQKTLQTVVRTRVKGSKYAYEPGAFAQLKDKLDGGWTVVMANPIGDEIEYILQKTEVKENG